MPVSGIYQEIYIILKALSICFSKNHSIFNKNIDKDKTFTSAIYNYTLFKMFCLYILYFFLKVFGDIP
jgi:hypothetical protein